MLLSAWLLNIQFNYLYPAVYLLLLSSLLSSRKRIVTLIFAVIALVICPLFKPGNVILFSIATTVDFIVFLIFLIMLIDQLVKKYTINLLLVLLFVYTSIDIVKLFDITVNINLGYVYYYFGVASQILFGISFWFIDENTKNFKINIKTFEEMET